MEKPVGLGLVGCGRIVQRVHLDALARTPGVRVVAAADPNAQSRAELTRRLPAVPLFQDYNECLACEQVEAVLLCLPNDLHAEAALSAFARARHVYLEKPLATRVDDGLRVVAGWRASGRVGMIGFNYRFHAPYLDLKAQLDAGRIGELLALRSVFATPGRELPGWKRERKSGGGVLLDYASHHIDLVRFLTGSEVREVSARIESLRSEHDTATLELKLMNGVLVQSFFALGTAEIDRLEVHGRSGQLTVDRQRSAGAEYVPAERPAGRRGRLQAELLLSQAHLRRALRSPREASFEAAFACFARAVRAGRTPRPDLLDGLRSLEVVAAAEEAARTGRIVSLAAPGEQ